VFVDVIKGSTSNPDATRRQIGEWVTRIAPHLSGWRGTTAGVTADGTFVAMTRIDADATPGMARDQWPSATPALLAGDRSSLVYDKVTLLDEKGNIGGAGFVQLVFGAVHDSVRADEYLKEFDSAYAPLRPDCIGRLMARRDDGQFVGVFYFTSEQDARTAEAQAVPPEIADLIQRGQALSDGPGTYLDLTSPWIFEPSAAMTETVS